MMQVKTVRFRMKRSKQPIMFLGQQMKKAPNHFFNGNEVNPKTHVLALINGHLQSVNLANVEKY